MRLLYMLVKPPIWIGLRLYFSKVVIRGEEGLPRKKPFLILPNHQNALMDVLVVASNLKSNPRFWARADIFKNKKALFWLESLGISPIFRPRDGMDQMTRNDETFQHSLDHLKAGTPYFIFPEGSHGRFPAVRPLKKGWARIAYRLSVETGQEMTFAPVMIHYTKLDFGGVPVEVEIENTVSLNAADQTEPHFAKEAIDKVYSSMSTHSPMASPENLSIEQWEKWQQEKPFYSRIRVSKEADQAFIEHTPIPPSRENPIVTIWRGLGTINHFWWIWIVNRLARKIVTDHHFTATGKFMIFWILGPVVLLLQSLLVGWLAHSWLIGTIYWILLHLMLPKVRK